MYNKINGKRNGSKQESIFVTGTRTAKIKKIKNKRTSSIYVQIPLYFPGVV